MERFFITTDYFVSHKKIKYILELAHDNKTAGHCGYGKTLSRSSHYHWKDKSGDVFYYCRGCDISQKNKDGRTKPFSEPQPLELPERRSVSVSKDFITPLPLTASGYDCITSFLDRFSKRVLIVPSKGTDSATHVADCFFNHIFCVHGLPGSIVSDRDPKFTSKVWSHLMDYCGIKLRLSISRHPQINSPTEIMNRMIGNYLRCYCAFHQKDWDQLRTTAEFAYNSAKVESMDMPVFEADLGWKPRSTLDLLALRKDINIQTVTDFP